MFNLKVNFHLKNFTVFKTKRKKSDKKKLAGIPCVAGVVSAKRQAWTSSNDDRIAYLLTACYVFISGPLYGTHWSASSWLDLSLSSSNDFVQPASRRGRSVRLNDPFRNLFHWVAYWIYWHYTGIRSFAWKSWTCCTPTLTTTGWTRLTTSALSTSRRWWSRATTVAPWLSSPSAGSSNAYRAWSPPQTKLSTMTSQLTPRTWKSSR